MAVTPFDLPYPKTICNMQTSWLYVLLRSFGSIHSYCTVFQKNWTFVISSHLCFDNYKLHEHFQKYIGVARCEYEINICDSLAILC